MAKNCIPQCVRREVAIKYGCPVGETVFASCHYCGKRGSIVWRRLRDKKPSKWVVFVGLELDHVVPMALGGENLSSNIELACMRCNRSKGAKPLKKWRSQ